MVISAPAIPEVWQSIPQAVAGSIATALQTTSGFAAYGDTRLAAAGISTTRVLNLGPGLWRLQGYFSFDIAAAATLMRIQFTMGTPSGTGGNSWNAWQGAPATGGARSRTTTSIDIWVMVPNGHTLVCDVSMDNSTGATTLIGDGGFDVTRYLG